MAEFLTHTELLPFPLQSKYGELKGSARGPEPSVSARKWFKKGLKYLIHTYCVKCHVVRVKKNEKRGINRGKSKLLNQGEIIMATNTEISQSERFETAFNRIHKALMKTVKHAKTDKFTDLVYKGKNHAFIRYYEKDLVQFAKLRNALVHEKIEEGYYIAEPHLDIIEKIEKMAEEFEKPESALSVASKAVDYFHEEDKLADVLAVIKKHSHSRFPVYDKNGEYIWLLTSAEIVKYLAENFDDEKMNLNQVKVSELYNEQIKHNIVFVSQNCGIFEVEDIFEEYQSKNKKLEAVIITKTGSPQETPNGIITSWDLLEVEISE